MAVALISAGLGAAGNRVLIGDHHAGIAEEGETIHGQIVYIAALRVGEKAPRVPRRHAVPARGLVVDDGGIHIPICGAVRPETIFLAALCGDQNTVASLRAVILPARHGHRLRRDGCRVFQREGQHRIALRVNSGDGGLFRWQVGDKPKASVLLHRQRHAQPVIVRIAGEIVRVVQPDGIALPLSGSDADTVKVVGVPVAMVIGLVLGKILEVLYTGLAGLIQRQPGVFQQYGVDGIQGELIRGTDQGAVQVKVAHQHPFYLRHGLGNAGAAVEQLIKVDVLGPFIERS